jgi:AraC family transcriptional regulator of adaptative response/methylated-DNA-[protein]-cysteine methyltransferase
MSAGGFHRVFKQATGLSPKQYALARRVEVFRDRLSQGEGVTSALYSAGFNASSRAYEASRRLGAKPNVVKSGGLALVVDFGVAKCSLGHVGFGLSERGLCALAFGDTAEAAQAAVQARLPKALLQPMKSTDRDVVSKIVQLVDRPGVAQDLPLDIQGTAFQERVWQALRKIPLGATRSYAEIAKAIGKPSAHRAVANACGANKIAVAIPCHRVVASDGGVGGYAFGVARKKALLAREARK